MTLAHLLGELLPPSSVKLGRLTTDPDRPHVNYVDPFEGRPSSTEIHEKYHQDFHETRAFTKQSRGSLRAGIVPPFSLLFSSSVSDNRTATLSAPQTTTQELDNYGQWFRDACLETRTRQWLETTQRDRSSIYLIVGVRSANNAKIASACERDVKAEAEADAVLPNTAPSQSNVGTDIGRGSSGDFGLTAVGQQVFAILCCRIRLGRWFNNTVDDMKLDSQRVRCTSVWDWGTRSISPKRSLFMLSGARDVEEVEIERTEEEAVATGTRHDVLSTYVGVESNKIEYRTASEVVTVTQYPDGRLSYAVDEKAERPSNDISPTRSEELVNPPREAESEVLMWEATLEEGDEWDLEEDDD